MEINSGHERPLARLGQAELAREDGREGFQDAYICAYCSSSSSCNVQCRTALKS